LIVWGTNGAGRLRFFPVRATWPIRPVSRGKRCASAPRQCAAFRLDDEFAGGVIEQGDADVVVAESVFQLLGDLVRTSSGLSVADGVAGE